MGVPGLRKLLDEVSVDVLFDVDFDAVALPDLCQTMSIRPLTVLLEGISHSRLQAGGSAFPRYDIYAVPSKWHLEETIRVRTRDLSVLLRKAETCVRELGQPLYKKRIANVFAKQCSKEDADYYRSHYCVVGTPSLDDLLQIDKASVKNRLGIDQARSVVGF